MTDSLDTRRSRPHAQEAVVLLLLVVGLTLLVGYPLQAVALIPGLLVTEWLLVALPVLLAVRLRRLSPRRALLIAAPRANALGGAVLAGLSGWYVVGVLVEQLQSRILPIPPEVLRMLRELVAGSGRPLVLDLLALAVSPAICEELLFRGFVLRATEREWSPTLVVALNALLFGTFHLSIYRFLPTAALGVVLAVLTLRARSVAPAMVFHLLNNAMTLLVARYMVGSGGELELGHTQALIACLMFCGGLGWALARSTPRELPDP